MATVHPTYNLASTPSTSSQSSLPPSYAITVHDHVLPPGWQCKYDPKTSKYYFLNETQTLGSQHWDFKKYGQHQSSCHSSRHSSPSHTFSSYGKYFQPFASRYKVSDSVPHTKISQQFPQVDDNYISHLMKIYHNRENLVISALLAEGFTRSFTLPADETLFYKLKSYFPSVDPELIRHMLIKHDNVEHEVIASIIASLGPNHIRYQSTALCPGSPKMKLRYLKLLYPEADEAILFDLLYNCDQNAMEAMNRLEKMGYKRNEITPRTPSVKPLDTDFSKIKAFRPQTAPIASKAFFPPNTTEKHKMIKLLEGEFPNVNSTLISMALESSGYNEDRARVFLSAMTPQDSSKYFPTDVKSIAMSPLMARICRGTQTNAVLDIVTGTPIKIAKTIAVKVTKGTSTTEDGIIIEEKKKPVAKGIDPSLRKGPNILNLIKSYFPWKGSDSKHKNGPNASNRKGVDLNLKSGPKTTAKGPQQSNRKGPLGRLIKLGRN